MARRREHGQAFVETILLTWLMIAFFAAVYQMFLVNQTIYKSLTAVHQEIFFKAYERNQPDTEYTTDQAGDGSFGARILWRPLEIPEVQIPTVGIFSSVFTENGLDPSSLRLSSNVRVYDDDCPDLPCKRTKMGSGNYINPWEGLLEVPEIMLDADFWASYWRRIQGMSN